MKYSNINVRRQNRLLEESKANQLLLDGEYGILSMVDKDEPYGIPLSFCWDKKESIYLHCALEGRKLDILKENNKASFCIVGKTNVIPHQFTTEYESIILKGIITLDLSVEERMQALGLLVDKYAPDHKAKGVIYAEKSLTNTNILRFDIEEFSGKCRRIS